VPLSNSDGFVISVLDKSSVV